MKFGKLFVLGFAGAVVGCGDSGAAQLSRKATPADAAAGAVAAFDKDGNGQISAVELETAPALATALKRFDANSDGELSREELEARFQSYTTGPDLIGVSVTVSNKGAALAGATLTLQPEPYMGEGLQSYSGVTTESGSCDLKGVDVALPGLPVGLYQAHIVHAASGLDKVIGCEIASDASGNRLVLKF